MRVEPSEEIRRVIDRWTRAIAEGDQECLARLSEHPGSLIVGTDPAEWWRGHETRAVWGRQIEELRGVFSVRADEIDAWEEGSVGWAAVKETIGVEGGALEGRARDEQLGARKRSSARSAAHLRMSLLRSLSGSECTPATRSTKATTSSARQSTTRHASPAKRSAAKFWCPMSSTTSSPVPGSTS